MINYCLTIGSSGGFWCSREDSNLQAFRALASKTSVSTNSTTRASLGALLQYLWDSGKTCKTRDMSSPNLMYIPILLAVILGGPEAHAGRSKKNALVDLISSSVNAALVNPPVDGEVCFSPDEPCDVKLTKFLNTATQSIDLAIYDFNLDKVAHDLLVISRKVKVRIVADRRQSKGGHSLIPMLVKAGAQVRFGRQRGIMHNKFMIVDGRMVETGSFNYTNGAAFKNAENQVYLAHPSIVKRYKERFQDLWESASTAAPRE